jgi:hypothetical protein
LEDAYWSWIFAQATRPTSLTLVHRGKPPSTLDLTFQAHGGFIDLVVSQTSRAMRRVHLFGVGRTREHTAINEEVRNLAIVAKSEQKAVADIPAIHADTHAPGRGFSLSTPACPLSLPRTLVLARDFAAGVSWPPCSGFQWRGKHGELPTVGSPTLGREIGVAQRIRQRRMECCSRFLPPPIFDVLGDNKLHISMKEIEDDQRPPK